MKTGKFTGLLGLLGLILLSVWAVTAVGGCSGGSGAAISPIVTPSPSPEPPSLALYAVGGNRIYFSSDGTTFTPVHTASNDTNLLSVWGTSKNNVYAAGQGDTGFTILRYDGTSWTSIPLTGISSAYGDVWGTGPQDVYAVQTAFYHSTDGVSWSQSGGLPLAGGGHTIWGPAADNLFALGYNYGDEAGFIGRSSNGSTWTAAYYAASVFLSDLWGSGADDLYAVGVHYPSRQAVVLHSLDGVVWTGIPTTPEAPSDLASLWGSGRNDIYLVGGLSRLSYWGPGNGSIQHFDGNTWTLAYSNTTGQGLADVWGTGAGGTVFCVGGTATEGIILKGSGTSWTQVFTAPVPLRGVWGCME